MLKTHEQSAKDTAALMAEIGRKARAASRLLAIAPTGQKNAALAAMADAILRNEKTILDANGIDVANGIERQAPPLLGGGIAERERHPTVGDLVEDDGDDEGRDQDDRQGEGVGHCGLDREPPVSAPAPRGNGGGILPLSA